VISATVDELDALEARLGDAQVDGWQARPDVAGMTDRSGEPPEVQRPDREPGHPGLMMCENDRHDARNGAPRYPVPHAFDVLPEPKVQR
jgi:hypothetical protein